MGAIAVLFLEIGVKRFLIICGLGFIFLVIKAVRLMRSRN